MKSPLQNFWSGLTTSLQCKIRDFKLTPTMKKLNGNLENSPGKQGNYIYPHGEGNFPSASESQKRLGIANDLRQEFNRILSFIETSDMDIKVIYKYLIALSKVQTSRQLMTFMKRFDMSRRTSSNVKKKMKSKSVRTKKIMKQNRKNVKRLYSRKIKRCTSYDRR